jgi:hypothetical protein
MKTRNEFEQPGGPSTQSSESIRSRKPYRAPAIVSSEKLEVFAVVCSPPGKGDPAACPSGPINS